MLDLVPQKRRQRSSAPKLAAGVHSPWRRRGVSRNAPRIADRNNLFISQILILKFSITGQSWLRKDLPNSLALEPWNGSYEVRNRWAFVVWRRAQCKLCIEILSLLKPAPTSTTTENRYHHTRIHLYNHLTSFVDNNLPERQTCPETLQVRLSAFTQ